MRLGSRNRRQWIGELACVLVRFDHVARAIVNANHSIMWPGWIVRSEFRLRKTQAAQEKMAAK